MQRPLPSVPAFVGDPHDRQQSGGSSICVGVVANLSILNTVDVSRGRGPRFLTALPISTSYCFEPRTARRRFLNVA